MAWEYRWGRVAAMVQLDPLWWLFGFAVMAEGDIQISVGPLTINLWVADE